MPCAVTSRRRVARRRFACIRSSKKRSRKAPGDMMKAHRTRVRVSTEHEIRIALPSDFPTGEAEVTVVGVEPHNDDSGLRKLTVDELIAARLVPPAGVGSVSLEDMERAIAAGASGRGGV